MNNAEWEQVRELFQAALKQPPGQRNTFVASRAADRPSLATEVCSLLRYAETDADFLEPPSQSSATILLTPSDPDGFIGKTVGNYSIKRILGIGGAGVVYEARQNEPERNVALKIMRAAPLLGGSAFALFEREVRALARLDHPGIAAIYEAGRTHEGLFFFAMEFVDGLSLTHYVRNNKPSLHQRLILFKSICDAISYAHRRGVIHRDLKPSNIVVNRDGRPKVLDFGLAKITDHDATATSFHTEMGRIQGTLAYMSPEQAGGDTTAIDVRSDVYSLGVVLFELLTERLPHHVTDISLTKAVRIICDREAVRPQGKHMMNGDLETIVLKALAKDPERRYQGTREFSEDIERVLANRPVRARRPTALYRFHKFAVRNRMVVALGAMLGISLGILVVLSIERALSIGHERDLAVEAKDEAIESSKTANAIIDFLTGFLEKADPNEMGQQVPTVYEVMTSAASAVVTDLENEPEVRSGVQVRLARIMRAYGDLDLAQDLANAAVITRRSLDDELGLAEALSMQSLVLTARKRHDKAEAPLREALEIRLRVLDDQDIEVAENYRDIATGRFYAKDYANAVSYFEKALSILMTADVDELEVVGIRSSLGLALLRAGRIDEGEAQIRQTYEDKLQLLGDHLSTTFSLDNLAHVALAKDDLAAAEFWLAEAVAMSRRLFHERHSRLSFLLRKYGDVVYRRHGAAKAAPILAEVLEIEREAGYDRRPDVADALEALAKTDIDLGLPEQAVERLKEALSIRLEHFGESEELEQTRRLLQDAQDSINR
ncbi:MAG: serine/threonine-protein kinase [Planctomycetota bacterium]